MPWNWSCSQVSVVPLTVAFSRPVGSSISSYGKASMSLGDSSLYRRTLPTYFMTNKYLSVFVLFFLYKYNTEILLENLAFYGRKSMTHLSLPERGSPLAWMYNMLSLPCCTTGLVALVADTLSLPLSVSNQCVKVQTHGVLSWHTRSTLPW